jgi:two-component system, NtrC family, sensor kinase
MTGGDVTWLDEDALRHARVHLSFRMGGARTLEACARAVCEGLYEELRPPSSVPDGAGGVSGCALVRCFKTHALGALEPPLLAHARTVAGVSDAASHDLPCLTLLASAGDERAWCSRHTAGRHRLILLPSQAALDRMPMVAAIFREFNVSLDDVRPRRRGLSSNAPNVYGVFHVEDAAGSPSVPDQDAFVQPYGIQSVVGFGGSLRHDDLYVVLFFAKTLVPPAVARRGRGLALDVTTSFFRYDDNEVFDRLVD